MVTRYRSNAGLSLVEILVSIAILAILMAFLFPLISNFISDAKRAKSASNLRQIGVAALTHVSENNGAYPQSIARANPGDPLRTWHQTLAPYLAYQPPGGSWANLHGLPASGIWDNPANQGVAADVARAGNYADYGWNHRLGGWANSGGGAHLRSQQRPANVSEPSKVFMVTEVRECNRDFRDSGWDYATAYHRGSSMNMLYADGHVEVLTEEQMQDYQDNYDETDYPWGWPGYSF